MISESSYPFPENQIYCILDYETFSEADLRKVGAWEYAKHPSTEILCAAWRIGTRATLREAPVRTWGLKLPGDDAGLAELRAAFANPAVILVAHNAYFEQVITRHVGGVVIPPERWVCTASLAATLALPRNLAGAGAALRLPIQKDAVGHKLMLKYCKPRKATKKNLATRHADPDELARLVDYCARDVEAETLLFLKCPPLTPLERRVWLLDQEINMRGFMVDRHTVKCALEMIGVEAARLNRETEVGTMGLISSANQRDAMLRWLESEGVALPDLRKGTVTDAIKSGLATGLAKTILEFRQAASKTSTAKYTAMEQGSRSDGRIRDTLIYHTASTGRWGGARIQPQNFPRGTIKNSIQAAEMIAAGDLEALRLIYGEPMEVFSSCLRSMIIAPPGKVLDVADYAAIEARVLAWAAGDEPALQVFRDGRDPYKELAAKIFGIEVTTVNSEQRFFGKTAELGAGYGLGDKKFREAAAQAGKEISDEFAKLVIQTYRAAHPDIVRLWYGTGNAALGACLNPGSRYRAGPCQWYAKGSFLWCLLPSGRRLAYAFPTVEWAPPPWGGDPVQTLFHYGVNGYSRKWEKQKTYGGKLVENIVQAMSRDIMAEAMLRIEDAGFWKIVLSVHDELVAERDIFTNGPSGSNELFCRLMSEAPLWAKGLPIKVEGWSGTRYRK